MQTNIRETFAASGYVAIPSVMGADEIDIYRKRLAEAFGTSPRAELGDSQEVRNLVLSRMPWTADLFFSNAVQRHVCELLGENYVIFPDNSIMDSQYGDWHTDTTSSELAGQLFRSNPDFALVNIAFYFQPNNEFGGGLDVVPGSHLLPDVFLDLVRRKNETYRQSLANPSPATRSIGDRFRDMLRPLIPEPILLARRRRAERFTLPIKSASIQVDQLTIDHALGGIVMFDLRLYHKASWPSIPKPFPVQARKYALFVICGKNNETSRQYRRYLSIRAQSEPAYAGMIGQTNPDWLMERAREAKATFL